MPPKKNPRTAATPSSSRMTRSQVRSNPSSRQTSIEPESYEPVTPAAAKPELKSRVSYAYGSVTKRAPAKIASNLHAGGLGAALQQTMELASTKKATPSERSPSVVSDGSDADQPMEPEGAPASVPGGPSRQSSRRIANVRQSSPIGSANNSLSMRLPKPYTVGLAAGAASGDGRGSGISGDDESEAPSSPDSEQLVSELLAAAAASAPAATTPGMGSGAAASRFVKWLLLGFFLAVAVAAALGSSGMASAVPAIATGLAVRAQEFLAALSLGHAASTVGRPAVTDPAGSFAIAELQTELQRLQGRIASLEALRLESRAGPTDQPTLRGINAFAPFSGVLVDHHLTSPTRKVSERTVGGAWFRALLGAPRSRPADPYNALTAWEDQGDCWCASTSPGGQAQLGLVLPRGVAPTTLVVEHINHAATPDPAAAPQDIELWIRITDSELRSIAAARSRAELGDGERSAAATVPALDGTWIRVLSGTYDPRAPVNSQAFDVPATLNLADLGIFARRVAVRVKSTWGSEDHACLYRLKMYGLFEDGTSSTLG
jgi:Sad1 / UNC-like C-terminal